jgi:hypothetical protein
VYQSPAPGLRRRLQDEKANLLRAALAPLLQTVRLIRVGGVRPASTRGGARRSVATLSVSETSSTCISAAKTTPSVQPRSKLQAARKRGVRNGPRRSKHRCRPGPVRINRSARRGSSTTARRNACRGGGVMTGNLTLTDRLEALFRSRPCEWLDGRLLANTAGYAGWRTRVSDLRRRG